jgi:predicted nucleic acid-binding protein
MIYLDTSAFIKLYLREEGSTDVHGLVVSQRDPLPVGSLIELEFINALRFKVFLGEMAPEEIDRLIDLYRDRRRSGQYYAPQLDPIALHELALQMTGQTPVIGCRALDILHVAAARLCNAARFLTADKRQAALARAERIDVALIPS